jgi:UDP-3-O-[3-hydroxymyristoyl] glucosamine N-acyltransferase
MHDTESGLRDTVRLLTDILFARDATGSAVTSGASLGPDIHIGNNVTIYPNVDVGSELIILDGAIIGRIPISNGTTTRQIRGDFGHV